METCSECGAVLDPGDGFCGQCGARTAIGPPLAHTSAPAVNVTVMAAVVLVCLTALAVTLLLVRDDDSSPSPATPFYCPPRLEQCQ